MAHFRLLAFNNPVPGREDEYNTWYTNQHLPDVLRTPGFKRAQRFRLTPTQKAGTPQTYQYMAMYECEAEHPQQLLDALAARVGTPDCPVSSALSNERVLWIVEPITDVVQAKG